MRGVVLDEVGVPLVVRKVDDLSPKEGYCVIEVLAAAFNRRDFWIQQGLYPGTEKSLPCVLGSDCVGTCVGSTRRVIVNPSLYWGASESAQGPDCNILGMPASGTFAEKVQVPIESVVDCPSHLSDVEAAALPLVGITAYRALFSRAKLEQNDRVLITGITGGVAMMGAQFAQAIGCEVCITTSTAEKAEAARKVLGNVPYVLRTDNEWWKEVAAKRGPFDVILDSSGGDDFLGCVKALAPGGRCVFVGRTAGAWPPINPAELFYKQASVLGSFMGSPKDFEDMVKFVEKHKIRPCVAETFDLFAAFDQAWAYFQSANRLPGKVVLTRRQGEN